MLLLALEKKNWNMKTNRPKKIIIKKKSWKIKKVGLENPSSCNKKFRSWNMKQSRPKNEEKS